MDEDGIISYLPYRVYLNLKKLLIYRKLQLVSGRVPIYDKKSKVKAADQKSEGTATWLDQETFTKIFQYEGFMMIETADADDKDRKYPPRVHSYTKSLAVKTIIILIDVNSEHISSAQDTAKLINNIPY